MKRICKICSLMVAVFLFISSSFHVSAETKNPDNMQEMDISLFAGASGVIVHDALTGKECLIEPEEYEGVSPDPVIASDDCLAQDDALIPYGIIGADNRTKISDPSSVARCNSTCLLGARFFDGDNGVAKGTGWLINQNYVATAGHMLYDDEYKDPKHVAVYLAASNGKYLEYRMGTEYHVGEDYKNNSDPLSYILNGRFDDWGILKVQTPFSATQHLGRYSVNSASEMTGTYYTQGYPRDLNVQGGISDRNWNKWYMYGTTGTITGDKMRYLDCVVTNIDAMKGQSGSPVYSYRTGLGYCAEAIIISGDEESSPDSQTILILINDWLQSYINNLP